MSPHSAPNHCYCCLSMASVTGIMGTEHPMGPLGLEVTGTYCECHVESW